MSDADMTPVVLTDTAINEAIAALVADYHRSLGYAHRPIDRRRLWIMCGYNLYKTKHGHIPPDHAACEEMALAHLGPCPEHPPTSD